MWRGRGKGDIVDLTLEKQSLDVPNLENVEKHCQRRH